MNLEKSSAADEESSHTSSEDTSTEVCSGELGTLAPLTGVVGALLGDVGVPVGNVVGVVVEGFVGVDVDGGAGAFSWVDVCIL